MNDDFGRSGISDSEFESFKRRCVYQNHAWQRYGNLTAKEIEDFHEEEIKLRNIHTKLLSDKQRAMVFLVVMGRDEIKNSNEVNEQLMFDTSIGHNGRVKTFKTKPNNTFLTVAWSRPSRTCDWSEVSSVEDVANPLLQHSRSVADISGESQLHYGVKPAMAQLDRQAAMIDGNEIKKGNIKRSLVTLRRYLFGEKP